VHLPVCCGGTLLGHAKAGSVGIRRNGMELLNGEVAEDDAQLAVTDILVGDGGIGLCEMPAAVGALEIRELDHDDRCIGIAAVGEAAGSEADRRAVKFLGGSCVDEELADGLLDGLLVDGFGGFFSRDRCLFGGRACLCGRRGCVLDGGLFLRGADRGAGDKCER